MADGGMAENGMAEGEMGQGETVLSLELLRGRWVAM